MLSITPTFITDFNFSFFYNGFYHQKPPKGSVKNKNRDKEHLHAVEDRPTEMRNRNIPTYVEKTLKSRVKSHVTSVT